MINPNQVDEAKIVFSIFKDYGPEVVFNNSDLSEDTALMLVMSGMTLVEMNKASIGRVDGTAMPRMLGPLPVPDREDVKAIALPFEVKITSSTDERISNSGYRLCVTFFLFKISIIREVLDSYGLIEPYFAMVAKPLDKEDNITPTNIKNLYSRMNDMFAGKIPRIFGLDSFGKVKEMVGKRIEYSDTYLVCDLKKKEMNVILYNSEMDVWKRRNVTKVASELNSNMFRSALRVKIITDINEMGKIFDHLNIEVSPN